MISVDLSKQSKSYPYDYKRDYEGYLESEVGSASTIKQTLCEQVELIEQLLESIHNEGNSLQASEQFGLEEPEEQGPSIKDHQFQSAIFAPSSANLNSSAGEPQVGLQIVENYGFNSKNRQNCISLSAGCYCLSLGSVVMLCPSIAKDKHKSYKFYSAHEHEITRLYYHQECKYLISGSSGLKPELILWKFKPSQEYDQCSLEQVRVFRLPRKSEAVGLVSFIPPSTILCAQAVQIHKKFTNVYTFEMESPKHTFSATTRLQFLVFDMCFAGQSTYFACQNGLYSSQQNKVFSLTRIHESTCPLTCLCVTKQFLLVGDRSGQITLLLPDGKVMARQDLHASPVLSIQCVGAGQEKAVASCEVGEKELKVSKLAHGNKMKVEEWQVVKLSSYCTSMDAVAEGVLLGLRDGSVTVYDPLAQLQTPLKYCSLSHLNKKTRGFQYNKISEKLFLNLNSWVYQLPVERTLPAKNKHPILVAELDKKSIGTCVDADRIYEYSQKGTTCCISARSIMGINGEEDVVKYQLEQEVQLTNVCRFSGGLGVVATKEGRLAVLLMSSRVALLSSQSHGCPLQDIVLQAAQFKQNTPYFVKTVAGPELFHWEVKGSESHIRKMDRKAGPLRDVGWASLCKYDWRAKKLWSTLSDYKDITGIALVDDRFLCAAMADGRLRIYKCPADPQHFREFKLFPAGFNIVACAGKPGVLACQSSCSVLVLKIRPS